MEVIICPDRAQVGRVAAAAVARIAAQVGPTVVLGLATGSSPLGLYEQLAQRRRDGRLDLSQAAGFALDEYVGLPYSHPESYHAVIDRTVTGPLGLDAARVHVPDGNGDVRTAGQRYEAAIAAAGGVDVQILGIGSNGHIGFNEPGSSLASRSRLKTLTAQTRADNARFFDSPADVPTHCLTQGLGTILDARRVVLVADGPAKAAAVAAMVEGPVSAFCPASVLQLHPHVTVVVDQAAAAELALADYYNLVQAELPDWARLDV